MTTNFLKTSAQYLTGVACYYYLLHSDTGLYYLSNILCKSNISLYNMKVLGLSLHTVISVKYSCVKPHLHGTYATNMMHESVDLK